MKIKKQYNNPTYSLLIQEVHIKNLSLYSSHEEKNNFIINLINDNSLLKMDDCSFLDTEIYENIDVEWSRKMSEDIFLLDSIYHVIKRKMEGKEWQFEKQNEEEFVVRRQASPPLEAYEYVPFNKMNIKQSKTSHAALHNLI
jgi:hypothetical protein